MYAQASQDQQGGGAGPDDAGQGDAGADSSGAGKDDDDVVDADFEEVK
jgi:hypothetical protein